MNLEKRAQNERRMIRRERWIGLWLMRLVAFLEAYERTPLGRALHGPIARILLIFSDALVNFIALRATWSPAYRRRIAAGRAAGCATAQKGADRRRANPRALLGGALRRALKAKSLKARAEALLRLMRMRDRWVAYMARRLARGQTRIYSAHSCASGALPLHQPSHDVLRMVPLPKTGFGEELRSGLAPP